MMSMVKLSKIGVAVLSPKTYTFANSPLSAAHGTAQAGGGKPKTGPSEYPTAQNGAGWCFAAEAAFPFCWQNFWR